MLKHVPPEAGLLESFHYKKAAQLALEETDRDFMLDSGAFSAKSLGITIDLAAYQAFITKYSSRIEIAAALDVIGDAAGTWENVAKMEAAGFSPMPVFHFGSPFSYLDRCLTYPRFALGGLVGFAKNRTQLFTWLDRCWERICDVDGVPKAKVHGFGMTGFETMLRYPWYSVDSTSWAMGSKQGAILIRVDKNKYKPVVVANDAKAVQGIDEHYFTLSKVEQKRIAEFVASYGWDIDVLTGNQSTPDIRDYDARACFNCQIFSMAVTAFTHTRFIRNEKGLFD